MLAIDGLTVRQSAWWYTPDLQNLPVLGALEGSEKRMDVPGRSSMTVEVERFIKTEAVGLTDYVAAKFFALPPVVAVAFQRSEDVLHVWTMVDNWDEAELDRVYELETQLAKRFEGLELDFHSVYTAGRLLEDLVDETTAYIIRRKNADQR